MKFRPYDARTFRFSYPTQHGLSHLRSVWILVLVALAFKGRAQQYDIESFGIEHGLPQAEVTHVVEAQNGYLLVATNGGGFARFDGAFFENFGPSAGLPDGKVTRFATAADGDLWVGHPGHGLVHFNNRFQDPKPIQGLPSQQVNAICTDTMGTIWVGTFGGLCQIVGDKLTTFTKVNGLPSNDVRAICKDAKGSVWIGTYGCGVARFDQGKFTELGTDLGLTDGFVSDLLALPDGRVLVAHAAGVDVWDGKQFSHLRNSGQSRVNAMAVDLKGNIWLATPEGVLVIDDYGSDMITDRNGLPHNEVLTVAIDREQNVWFGTRKGLARLSYFAFTHFGHETRASLEPSCILRSPDGTLLLTDRTGGVHGFNGRSFSALASADQEMQGRPFSSMAVANDGAIWLGTTDFSGLYRLLEGKTRIYADEPGLADNNVTALASDATGLLVIGTPNGLSYYNGKVFYNSPFQLGAITTIAPLSGLKCLIGTAAGAVVVVDSLALDTVYTGSLPITAIVAMADGRLALGTDGDGVFILKGGKVEMHFTEANGLTSSHVRSLVFDGRHLWAGLARGLVQILPKADKPVLFALTQENGFMGSECLPGAMFNDGVWLWVGTIKGVSRIRKKLVEPNKVKPLVAIGSVHLLKKDASGLSELSGELLATDLDLEYDNNHIRFQFKAISLTDPSLIMYQWRLIGFEQEWNEGPIGTANYPNLPPGQYVFEVVACNRDGLCSQKPGRFAFAIHPPFWQTTWFYLIIVAILSISLITVVRWREKQLKEQNRELEQKVTERTIQLKEQKDLVEEKNRHIMEGIEYARNIQMAILPSEAELISAFKEHFVLYLPKDMVGGDFYWAYHRDGVTWAVAADCTGHGVAGAFMSMIGSDLLTQLIIEQEIASPAAVLSELDRGIKLAFSQSDKEFENDRGMDLAIVKIDKGQNTLVFAGAIRPMIVIGPNGLTEYEGDRHSISSKYTSAVNFTDQRIVLTQSDTVYLFSDGICDQFGGPKGKKFSSKQVRETLLAMTGMPLQLQMQHLNSVIKHWQGDEVQLDDILVMAFRT